jgi:hypothetical protein
MSKFPLVASIAFIHHASSGGVLATVVSYLSNAAPTATGMTMIAPDGTARYISREDAERFANAPKAGEVRQ